jgi:hypothetical protein
MGYSALAGFCDPQAGGYNSRSDRGDPMNWLKPARSLMAAILLLPGATALAQDKAEAPPFRVYDAGELPPERYTVVKRIWAGTWRASFWVPTRIELADAIENLTAQAVDAGADGVVNLHCLSDPGSNNEYFCYGLAIKLKPPAFATRQPPVPPDSSKP